MSTLNDLRTLNVFVTVYKQCGISSAARVLNLSQPSVTRSVHRLEYELGAHLFDRTKTGLVPTEFGTRVYRRALSIIDEADSIYADARRLRADDRHLLNIGSGHGCWCSISDAILSYRELHPETVFNLTVASARALLNASEAGGLDVIVANMSTLQSATWLRMQPFLTTVWYYVASADHPVFDAPEDQQLSLIAEYPFITYHMLEHAHGTTMSGSAILRANDYLLLMRHAARSLCYLTVSEKMLDYARLLGLRVVGADRSTAKTEFGLAVPADSPPAREIAPFVQHLIDSVHTMT